MGIMPLKTSRLLFLKSGGPEEGLIPCNINNQEVVCNENP
jgi:hypothetical protein